MLCLIRYDANVFLCAGIDFEVARKLATKPCDLDSLAGAQAANVDARGGANERMNFAGAVINEDDESEGQIIDDRLSDCSSNPDQPAFRIFAYIAGGDCKRPHFRTPAMSFDIGHIYEHK